MTIMGISLEGEWHGEAEFGKGDASALNIPWSTPTRFFVSTTASDLSGAFDSRDGTLSLHSSSIIDVGGTGGADYEVVMWPPAGREPLEAFYVTSVGNGRELDVKDSGWSIQSDTIMFTDAVGTITDKGVLMPTNSRRLSSSSGGPMRALDASRWLRHDDRNESLRFRSAAVAWSPSYGTNIV